jgi:Flavin reductase like domain
MSVRTEVRDTGGITWPPEQDGSANRDPAHFGRPDDLHLDGLKSSEHLAFSSLSLDPPLVLVCIDRGRYMHQVLSAARGFAVHVLRADQRDIALNFARRDADRFGGLDSQPGRHGAALITGAIAHVECDVHSILDGGDHPIIVGQVEGVAVHSGDPLLYAQGAFLEMPKPDWDRALADAPHEWLLSAPW